MNKAKQCQLRMANSPWARHERDGRHDCCQFGHVGANFSMPCTFPNRWVTWVIWWRTCRFSITRLALTSALGPFAAHLLKFILQWPRCIDALFGVRIPFQSLAQRRKGNPDSSPETSHVYTSHSPIIILGLQKRLIFLLYLALFRLLSLSKRKIIEPSLTTFTGFPFALVFIVCSRRNLLVLFTVGHRYHSPCFPLTLASRVTTNIVYF